MTTIATTPASVLGTAVTLPRPRRWSIAAAFSRLFEGSADDTRRERRPYVPPGTRSFLEHSAMVREMDRL